MFYGLDACSLWKSGRYSVFANDSLIAATEYSGR
jgi:hypothetical protein